MNKDEVKDLLDKESFLRQEKKAVKKQPSFTFNMYEEEINKLLEGDLLDDELSEEFHENIFVPVERKEKQERVDASKNKTNRKRSSNNLKTKSSKFLIDKSAKATKFGDDKDDTRKIKSRKFDQTNENLSIATDKRINGDKLSEMQLKQKMYFENKFSGNETKPKSSKDSEDVLKQKYIDKFSDEFTPTYAVNRTKSINAVSNTVNTSKYYINQALTYETNNESNEEATKRSINKLVPATVASIASPKTTPFRDSKFVVGNLIKPSKKELVSEQDLIIQEKKNLKRFIERKNSSYFLELGLKNDFARKVASKIKNIAVRSKILMIIAILSLVLLVSGLVSAYIIADTVFTGVSGYVAGLSPAKDLDMTEAENYFAKMESELQEVIDNIEEFYPDFDEYVVIFDDEIGHDPLKLMAYLSTVYGGYEASEIEDVLDKLFDDIYEVNIEIETKEDEDGEEYSVFTFELIKHKWEEVVETKIDTEKKDVYESYTETGGGHQSLESPFKSNWTSNITSEFGWRIHPISGEEKFHSGVDIAKPKGTPVNSCSVGVVVKSYYSQSAGNYIVIEDETGYQCHYMHLNDRFVAVGDEVDYDTVIGVVGSTGNSTGPHLHLAITDKAGNYLNPKFLVQGGY